MINDRDIKELIPKHKDDQNVIDGLKKLSFYQLEPTIPNLLIWLQDMNWPIAGPIAEVLKPFGNRITAEIIKILKTGDDGWEWNVLAIFARNTTDPLLLSEIERIAKFPTKSEIDGEVDLEAMAILNGDYK